MKSSKGFTLIEVIITITIMAIAAAAFIAYFGSAFTSSAVPAGQVQRQYQLVQQMETITSQYRNAVTNSTSGAPFIAAFKIAFVDGRQYVDGTQTVLITLQDDSNAYTTRSILKVVLVNGDQTMMSIFTE